MKSIFATEQAQMNESKSEIAMINEQNDAIAWKEIAREIIQANLDLYDLTDREKHIIMLRYGLLPPFAGRTPTARGVIPYAAIAPEIGVSKQRIHKILEKALEKISDSDKENCAFLPSRNQLKAILPQKSNKNASSNISQ